MKRILLVDDDTDWAHLAGMILTQAGHQVSVFSAIDEAYSYAKNETLDLALINLQMPGGDGPLLEARLRVLPHLRATRIVIFTFYELEAAQEHSRFTGFLHQTENLKNTPVSIGQLNDLVS